MGLIEERVTMADVAIFPFIRQFSRVDYEWFEKAPYERLQHWLGNLDKSALFLSVMNKYERWTKDSKIEYLG